MDKYSGWRSRLGLARRAMERHYADYVAEAVRAGALRYGEVDAEAVVVPLR